MKTIPVYPPGPAFIPLDAPEALREWQVQFKLIAPGAAQPREEFRFKSPELPPGESIPCRVVGFDGQPFVAVVELPDGRRTCIHAAYLKEMQSPKFTFGGDAEPVKAEAEEETPAPEPPPAVELRQLQFSFDVM